MPKINQNPLSDKQHRTVLEKLIATFSRLKSKDEIQEVFDSLFTEVEKLMLAKRLAIALLLENGVSYKEISRILKVSPVTVGFIKRNVVHRKAGYKKLLAELNSLDRSVLEKFSEFVSGLPQKHDRNRWQFLRKIKYKE